MDDDFWYVYHSMSGRVVGPMPKAELLDWLCTWPPETMVWCSLLPTWTPANTVPGLIAPVQSELSPAIHAPHQSIATDGQHAEASGTHQWHEGQGQTEPPVDAQQTRITAETLMRKPPMPAAPEPQPQPVAGRGNPWKNRQSAEIDTGPIRNWTPEFNGVVQTSDGMFFYRVYVRQLDLVFVWAGTPVVDQQTQRRMEQSGGGLAGGANVARALSDAIPTMSEACEKRVRMLNCSPVRAVVNDHESNFCVTVADITGVQIDPRMESFRGPHHAVFRMMHRRVGKVTMWLTTVNDVDVALLELPRVFGSQCRVGIEWNGTAFVRKA